MALPVSQTLQEHAEEFIAQVREDFEKIFAAAVQGVNSDFAGGLVGFCSNFKLSIATFDSHWVSFEKELAEELRAAAEVALAPAVRLIVRRFAFFKSNLGFPSPFNTRFL